MEKTVNRDMFRFSSATVTADGNGTDGAVEIQEPEVPVPPAQGPKRDRYRSVIFLLFVAAPVGITSAIVGTTMTSDMVLLQVAITLSLAVGILTGVATAQSRGARSATTEIPSPDTSPTAADCSAEPQSVPKLEPIVARQREGKCICS
jgi:hypothetical protein